MANSLNIELENRYVVLKSGNYKGTDIQRVFLCKDGFGCGAKTRGRAIYGEFVFDGEQTRVEGYEIERLATSEEIEEAKKIREGE